MIILHKWKAFINVTRKDNTRCFWREGGCTLLYLHSRQKCPKFLLSQSADCNCTQMGTLSPRENDAVTVRRRGMLKRLKRVTWSILWVTCDCGRARSEWAKWKGASVAILAGVLHWKWKQTGNWVSKWAKSGWIGARDAAKWELAANNKQAYSWLVTGEEKETAIVHCKEWFFLQLTRLSNERMLLKSSSPSGQITPMQKRTTNSQK